MHSLLMLLDQQRRAQHMLADQALGNTQPGGDLALAQAQVAVEHEALTHLGRQREDGLSDLAQLRLVQRLRLAIAAAAVMPVTREARRGAGGGGGGAGGGGGRAWGEGWGGLRDRGGRSGWWPGWS